MHKYLLLKLRQHTHKKLCYIRLKGEFKCELEPRVQHKRAQANVEQTMVNHLLSRSKKAKKVLDFCSLEFLTT